MKHTVSKGETLISISKKYDVTVEALVASNGITNKNLIRAGQVLTIPANYAEIGKKVSEVIKDIEKLPSFNDLCKML